MNRPKKPARPDELQEAVATVTSLALALPPVQPQPDLRARLMERLRNEPRLNPAAFVPAGATGWKSSFPGIEFKLLYKEPKTGFLTMLVRMQAGAMYPAHHHFDNEQCLVIEGDIRWGEYVYRKGDFVVTGEGTTHPSLTSDEGNVLLIISRHNEFVKV